MNALQLIVILCALIASLTGCLIYSIFKLSRLENEIYDTKAALALKIGRNVELINRIDGKVSMELKALSHSNKETAETLEELAKEVSGLKKAVDDIPVDEIVQRNKDEADYFAGLQNIFNYGDEVPKLNLDGISK